jgi:hypothetical protein
MRYQTALRSEALRAIEFKGFESNPLGDENGTNGLRWYPMAQKSHRKRHRSPDVLGKPGAWFTRHVFCMAPRHHSVARCFLAPDNFPPLEKPDRLKYAPEIIREADPSKRIVGGQLQPCAREHSAKILHLPFPMLALLFRRIQKAPWVPPSRSSGQRICLQWLGKPIAPVSDSGACALRAKWEAIPKGFRSTW